MRFDICDRVTLSTPVTLPANDFLKAGASFLAERKATARENLKMIVIDAMKTDSALPRGGQSLAASTFVSGQLRYCIAARNPPARLATVTSRASLFGRDSQRDATECFANWLYHRAARAHIAAARLILR